MMTLSKPMVVHPAEVTNGRNGGHRMVNFHQNRGLNFERLCGYRAIQLEPEPVPNGPVVYFKRFHFYCSFCNLYWQKGSRNAEQGSPCRICACTVFPHHYTLTLTPYQGPQRIFGRFKCHNCFRYWTSTCSWAQTAQYCQTCRTSVFPHHQNFWDREFPNGRRRNGWRAARSNHRNLTHVFDLCQRCIVRGVGCFDGRMLSFVVSTESYAEVVQVEDVTQTETATPIANDDVSPNEPISTGNEFGQPDAGAIEVESNGNGNNMKSYAESLVNSPSKSKNVSTDVPAVATIDEMPVILSKPESAHSDDVDMVTTNGKQDSDVDFPGLPLPQRSGPPSQENVNEEVPNMAENYRLSYRDVASRALILTY